VMFVIAALPTVLFGMTCQVAFQGAHFGWLLHADGFDGCLPISAQP